MSKSGEVFVHSVTGSKLIFIKTAEDTNGEYLEVEQIIKPGSDIIPAHYHMLQTETFHVISGEAIYQLNGKKALLKEGETVSFPPGTSHVNPIQVGNKDLHLRVKVSPALDFHILLETIVRAAEKGDANPDGTIKKLHQAVLLNGVQSKVYLAGQPIWLQKLLFPVLAFFGKRAGYTCGYPTEPVKQ